MFLSFALPGVPHCTSENFKFILAIHVHITSICHIQIEFLFKKTGDLLIDLFLLSQSQFTASLARHGLPATCLCNHGHIGTSKSIRYNTNKKNIMKTHKFI
jgi:hypothetical protein